MINKTTLVIRGPFEGNMLEDINKSLEAITPCPLPIVVVSYVTDTDIYKTKLKSLKFLEGAYFLTVKDVFNPGFFNINRQLHCAQEALKNVHTPYVIMLRNDQSVNIHIILELLSELKPKQLISVNTFTRKDRLYHPSDMFIAGATADVKEYFSLPLQEQTHLEGEYEALCWYRKHPECISLVNAPEQRLFKHYLSLQHWKLKNTFEDSKKALHKYIYLVNSWDISLRWSKSRTYGLKGGSIILPHYFRVSPFQNMPAERVRCWNRHDFYKKPATLKDCYYILLSRICWFFWPVNESGIEQKLRVWRRKQKNRLKQLWHSTIKIFR